MYVHWTILQKGCDSNTHYKPMSLEDMLSIISQAQRNEYCLLPNRCLRANHRSQSQRDGRSEMARGREEGGTVSVDYYMSFRFGRWKHAGDGEEGWLPMTWKHLMPPSCPSYVQNNDISYVVYVNTVLKDGASRGSIGRGLWCFVIDIPTDKDAQYFWVSLLNTARN